MSKPIYTSRGPYAFPGAEGGGMTLRDWFAGMALASMDSDDDWGPRDRARIAYGRADAMLEARRAARTEIDEIPAPSEDTAGALT